MTYEKIGHTRAANPPTTEQFIEAVDLVVERAGRDFVYPAGQRCIYQAREFAPVACLFGQALSELGFDVPPQLEDHSIDKVLHDMFGWDQNAPVCRAAESAQEDQDSRYTWGYARESFYEVLGREL